MGFPSTKPLDGDTTMIIHSNENKQHVTTSLINISEQAKLLGYAVPVAITQAVWNKYIGNNDDLYSKLKNILLMLAHSIHKSPKKSVIHFRLFPMPGYGIVLKTTFALLKAKILRDGDGNPKVVIMLPRE